MVPDKRCGDIVMMKLFRCLLEGLKAQGLNINNKTSKVERLNTAASFPACSSCTSVVGLRL